MRLNDNHYLVRVEEGQGIWDMAIQEYGTVAEVFRLLRNNPSLNLNSHLSALQLLSFEQAVLLPEREAVMRHFRVNEIKVNTHDYFTDSCYLLQENGDPILQENYSYLLTCPL